MTEPENVGRPRDPLDALLEEYLAQYRRGDAESLEEFVERSANANPEDAARIRELLPQLAQVQVLLESVVAETPTAPPLLEPGQQIRHYRVERHIGSGGMGEVYLARNTMLDSSVAMKLLSPKFSTDPQLSAAFEREARMAARLDHPNIATVHDFFRIDGRHYLVMEFVEGQSLGHLIRDAKRIPLARVLDIGVQITEALAAAHSRAVIHRDLKPDNVMITRDGRVKILDFGLAKVDRSPAGSPLGDSVFGTGIILGTVGYMSPEQVRAQPVDARSDLFALGVVLYEMATGRAPFRRPTFADTQSAILNEQPELATNLNPEVPAGLAQLIDKLLAKNPEDRYPSADAVVEDLNALRAPRTAAPPTLSMRILRIVAVLTLLALLILWLLPSDEDPRIAELTGSLSSDAATLQVLLDAKGLLRDLERDLGANKPELAAPRELLRTKVAAASEKWLEHLATELASGATDVDTGQYESIRRLDDAGTTCEQANALVRRARDLRARVSGTRDDVEQLLDSKRLDEAWETITTHLNGPGVQFEGRVFEFATKTTAELRETLLGLLVDLLNDLDDSQIERFKGYLDLLKRMDRSHPDIQRFDGRAEELQKRHELRRLQDAAQAIGGSRAWWEVTDREARGIVDELEKLDWQVGNIDPQRQSGEHAKVRALLETWKAAGEVCHAFAKGQRLDHPSVPADERSAAGAASAWLKSYAKAFEDAAQDPARAEAALPGLDPTRLAPRFRDAASGLIRQLEVEIAASADASTKQLIEHARGLVEAIRERSRKLQPPTGNQNHELAALRSRPELKGLDSLFEPVTQALDDLERHEAEVNRREDEYARLRAALRGSDSLAGLGEKFARLMESWRREKETLDTAIEYSPEAPFDGLQAVHEDLLWRRALMNLRLRRYSDALDDVRASKRDGTLEGLLLSGMSKFGLGMLDEASKDFGKAALAKADHAQARALYWLGTIANAQERSTDALTYLGRALEPGDGPADAYRQVAELYVARGKAARAGNESDWRPWFSRAITAASRSLDSRSGYTEDEMVALFAGIPLSEYPARAKEFRYTALLARADAHFNLGDYASCIKDCTDVVSICPTLAEAYYWRGCARYASGDGEEAVRDLDGAMDRAADGSPVKRLAQDLKKQILGE